MLNQCERPAIRRRRHNLRFRIVTRQCQEGIELGIVRKAQRLRYVRHRPVIRNGEISPIGMVRQRAAHVQRIAGQEARQINQQRAIGRLRNDLAGPDERASKRFPHRLAFQRIFGACAIGPVLFLRDDFFAHAAERQDLPAIEIAPVQSDRVRAQPRRQ